MSKAKRNVAYTKPPEPAFLRKLKERAGYEEGPNIETKRESLPVDSDNEDKSDDEKPLVVVLNEGDLTAEEAEKIMKTKEKEKEGNEPVGRLQFQKPVKRSSDEKQNPLWTSTKKSKIESVQSSSKDQRKQIKNTSLLSFDEDEDY